MTRRRMMAKRRAEAEKRSAYNYNRGVEGFGAFHPGMNRSADDLDLGGFGDFVLPAPGAPEPMNGLSGYYRQNNRLGEPVDPATLNTLGSDCGCGGGCGGCGGGDGLGAYSEGVRIGMAAGALAAIVMGRRAEGTMKYAAYAAAAALAYLAYEGQMPAMATAAAPTTAAAAATPTAASTSTAIAAPTAASGW